MAQQQSGGPPAFEYRPSQSISSTVVDMALIAAVVYLAKIGIKEAVVWSLLSAVTIGRFGVSHNKTLERATRGGDGSSRSGPNWPEVTPDRDPRSFPIPPAQTSPTPLPRRDPRRDPERASLPELALPRLYAWIRHRRRAPPMPWWVRRSIAIPYMPVRIDALSLMVFLVLTFTMIRVFAAP